ncbi:dihydroxy-acid dehydratase [Bacillus litorisediminis]|uniref:dihydroxy-acid dehydratase n=1 Tax=Bacillus litorisediminis TaxID=2922713 RepID=UPI001FAD6B5F|nr:dihydroxy-acid dehydratase [Bacillus litorisediminis]
MYNNKLTSYGDIGFSKFIRKAFNRQLGFSVEDQNKPIIGICNTYSEINRCHSHLKPIVEAIKKGVLMAGGIPLEFPIISLGEINTYPTTMLYRNLAAMDTEEMINAQPIDGVVLIGGCDKMAPALLMGAASADIPSILITGGPMNNGEYRGRTLGACSDCRYFWQEYRANAIDEQQLMEINEKLAPTAGHCMVMGSASSIAVCTETMGLMLPGGASIPATHNERLQHSIETGKAIVRLVEEGKKFSDIVTENSIRNAITALMAIGGSTNTIIHLIAIARRLGFSITLKDFDEISQNTPLIANIRPAGKYQMEDFHKAGGVPVLLKELQPYLYLDEQTVTGKTLRENLSQVSRIKEYEDIIRTEEKALSKSGGLAVLYGSLAPRGAIVKHSTASIPYHKGRALVFENIHDMDKRIDDPDLDVDKDTIMVLKNIGPIGAPGMPEAGYIPIPKKLLAEGVKDMVRISDGRMSGTAFGTVILHVSPEAAAGGPLNYVLDGDIIEFDLENRELNLLVSEEEIEKRKREIPVKPQKPERGYQKMFVENVLQADEGCDFKFL